MKSDLVPLSQGQKLDLSVRAANHSIPVLKLSPLGKIMHVTPNEACEMVAVAELFVNLDP